MTRKILIAITAAIIGMGAYDCAAGAPKPECQDGSVKVEVNDGKRSTYHCENGEWVKQ